MAKKARKAKAATKKKSAKASAKKAGKKSAVKKKASAKKARVGKAKKVAKKAQLPLGAVMRGAAAAPKPAAPKPAVPPDDEAKLAAVGQCVDNIMNSQHPGWSTSENVSKYYTSVSIIGVLTLVRQCLKPTYNFVITSGFPAKAVTDTILKMIVDIADATT